MMSSDTPSPDPDAKRDERLADAMPHIVWTHDGNGVPTFVNLKWTEYTGCDLAETLRVGPHTFVHPSDVPEVERLSQEARRGGDPFQVSYRLRARDGAFRWHAARVGPLRDEGRVVSWVGTAVDVDEQRRAQDEQRFLIEASRVLGTSLDLATTLSDVARLVVPHLADWCAIDLLTDAGELQRLAVAHIDPAKVALAWELWRLLPPKRDDPHGAYAVMRTRRAEMFEDIPDELLAASISDPEMLAVCRSLGLRSSMCVALVARDRVLGALSLVSTEAGRRFGARDLAFAEELALRVTVAVDNAQLYAEVKAARTAAEAIAAHVTEQSREVQAALLAMRAERDAAVTRLEALEDAGGGLAAPP